MIVTFTHRNDTADDRNIGDEDGDGDGGGGGPPPPVRTVDPPGSSPTDADKQPEIRTFSYYVFVNLGKIA